MTNGTGVPLARAGAEHGNKAANLGWLISHGFHVPNGIVVGPADDAVVEWVQPGQRYAVRSSASVEDRPDFSFAGQFTTVLEASGVDAVRQAIEQVLASARDERLAPYLEHAGVDPTSVEMHVIVQQMVSAKAAGVAFSRNPLTGLADVLIEAVAGMGDALVAGTKTPERWVRHWGDWTQRPDAPVLPESVAIELADQVARMAEQWGAPVDVEWAWDGQAIAWLQVRPMTMADVPVYSNRLAKEFLPGMIPPLVWSINVPMVNRAWLDLFESVVGPLDLEPEDLSRQFAYRAYFDMRAVGDIFEAMSMPRDLLEVLIGIEGGDDRPTFRPRMGVMRHLPRISRVAWRVARYHRELDRVVPEFEAELNRLGSGGPSAMSDRDLLGHLAETEAIVSRIAFANILAPLLFLAYSSLLRRRLERRGVDAHDIDFGAGEPGLADYDPVSQLQELAGRAAQLDESDRARMAAGDVNLVPGMSDFLERFGHVSDSGNDFSQVPWREDPARLASLLAPSPERTEDSSVRAELPNDLSRLERRLARTTARYRLERERVSYTYTRGYGQLRPIVLEVGERLVQQGLLDERADVFYVTRSEMEAALISGQGDPRSLAATRKAEMEAFIDVEMPEVIFGDAFEPTPAADPDHRLQGTPSSRGVARANARVVKGIEEVGRVAHGDIVVIPYSDVGWTPMLARAGGIVAEAGGLLSHSSIVAREFGIPCVVSVPGATRIPDGATVRVDGYTGEIQWEQAA